MTLMFSIPLYLILIGTLINLIVDVYISCVNVDRMCECCERNLLNSLLYQQTIDENINFLINYLVVHFLNLQKIICFKFLLIVNYYVVTYHLNLLNYF